MRTFTPQEIRSTTIGQLQAMSQEDQQAYHAALWRLMEDQTAAQIERDNRRDGADWENWA